MSPVPPGAVRIDTPKRSIMQYATYRILIARYASRKLELLDSVKNRDELKIPPGNRLEALSGDRKGQHSIRINDQYRICFRWTRSGPDEVEIADYH